MVPPSSALYKGIAVNVVLKAHQKSGKLTFGHIQDVLTRGNHPRGVKVRLQDGQIGRVQSLAESDSRSAVHGSIPIEASTNGPPTVDPMPQSPLTVDPGNYAKRSGYEAFGVQRRTFAALDEQESQSLPAETRSLEDYVVVKKPRRRKERGAGAETSDFEMLDASDVDGACHDTRDPQTLLQSEFPGIDSALIAAILSDGVSIEDAQKILRGIAE